MANDGAGLTASELLWAVPGLKYPTLNFWITSGLLEASGRAASGKGSVRRFLLPDVTAAQVIMALRSRISLQQLRKVTARLRRSHQQAQHPLASTTLFIVPGDTPDVARVEITDDANKMLESLVRNPGQRFLTPVLLPLEPIVREVRERVAMIQLKRDEREAMRRARARVSMREASRRYQARKRDQRRGAAMP